MRRLLLQLLPKVALSRVTGVLTDVPVPRGLRRPYYRWFARRYGADLDEIDGDLADFPSLSAFFRRPLRPGVRPVDPRAPLVWPADGRIVTSGPIESGRVPQVKGVDYPLGELLVDGPLAARLANGTQCTIYLAPGDYHRVHSPYDGRRLRHWHVPGSLFPVNGPAVDAIPGLFVRNERMVFEFELADGRCGAVVMVAALNVGDIRPVFPASGAVARGDEIGAFGFGSTVVAVVEDGAVGFAPRPRDTVVRVGGAATVTDFAQ